MQGRKPMRDHDRRPASHKRSKRLTHASLAYHIETGECFIEHKNSWLLKHSPRQRNALSLSGREPRATLAHQGIVPLGQGGNKFVQVYSSGRGGDLFR
jgi:hypothetical protein